MLNSCFLNNLYPNFFPPLFFYQYSIFIFVLSLNYIYYYTLFFWFCLHKKLNLFKKCSFFLYLQNYDILNYIHNDNFYTYIWL